MQEMFSRFLAKVPICDPLLVTHIDMNLQLDLKCCRVFRSFVA